MGIEENVTTAADADRFETPGGGSWGNQVFGEHMIAGDDFYPAGGGYGFHYHPNQEEVMYVLEGSVEVWVDRESTVLNPGDFVRVPPGVVHADFNASDTDGAKVLLAGAPRVDSELVGHRIGMEVVNVDDEEPWASLRK